MNNGHKLEMDSAIVVPESVRAGQPPAGAWLHPAWRAFLSFCVELKHGDIERLKIQDGVPVLAEVTKKKVKFGL